MPLYKTLYVSTSHVYYWRINKSPETPGILPEPTPENDEIFEKLRVAMPEKVFKTEYSVTNILSAFCPENEKIKQAAAFGTKAHKLTDIFLSSNPEVALWNTQLIDGFFTQAERCQESKYARAFIEDTFLCLKKHLPEERFERVKLEKDRSFVRVRYDGFAYGGTADAVFTDGESRYIFEYKTSAGLSRANRLQVLAYSSFFKNPVFAVVLCPVDSILIKIEGEGASITEEFEKRVALVSDSSRCYKKITGDEKLKYLLEQKDMLKARLKEIESLLEQEKARVISSKEVQESLTTCGVCNLEGVKIRETLTDRRILQNAGRLALEYPELYEKFVSEKQTKSYRVTVEKSPE